MLLLATISAPIVVAAIGLAGIVIGLWINGDRTERQRRRDLHARALGAVHAYAEMPFMIRRRRHEEEHQSGERVRLSERFSDIQAELSTCKVLLAADGDQRISRGYNQLVQTARETAGQEAHDGWKQPAIRADPDMNMRPLFDRLEPSRGLLQRFEAELARATLPRRLRIIRWLRGIDL